MKNNGHIFILISSDSPSGPIKGAYALANLLVDTFNTTLVSLKHGTGASAKLDRRVEFYCLADLASNFLEKTIIYKKMLVKAGGRNNVTSLSMTLSADTMNLLCRRNSITCSSIRGNLLKNYYHDYGVIGYLIAFAHLFSLRFHDKIIVMTESMANQVKFYSGRAPCIISNFIDEDSLDLFRITLPLKMEYRFIFIGSLSERKQPLVLIDAFNTIIKKGLPSRLDIVGNGPLMNDVKEKIKKYKLEGSVYIHGFIDKPSSILSAADVMVLPSLSEGISRASMEALYLGVPCVLRNVDGNSEIITQNVNGVLFSNNADLAESMLQAIKISREGSRAKSLLPHKYKRDNVFQYYRSFLGTSDGK
jgi:glycosyltransferase involved in cell wall biosynthesis